MRKLSSHNALCGAEEKARAVWLEGSDPGNPSESQKKTCRVPQEGTQLGCLISLVGNVSG